MGAIDDMRQGNDAQFPIVGIGASAGGLKAAGTFLENTPADSGMAFVLVFHLDPNHKSEAAELLQARTSMPVAQVKNRTRIEANHVYVVPPNHGLALVGGEVTLTQLARADGHPTVIDRFFRSLAEHAGEHAIGVVLSGTGSEGSQGLKAIKEAGGLSVVQDEGEAEYNGMPRSAIATGLIDFVLPVAKIPAKLVEIKDFAPDFALSDSDRTGRESDAEVLQKIFVQLRTRVGRDFSHYKQSTILRRISRRLQVLHLPDLGAYLEALRNTPAEAEALCRELLISVTNFFRDPEAMGALEHDVIPELCKRMEGQTVRVWVPGCATGEEAYSLAIMLGEACDGLASPPRLQVFASDVDGRALDVARRGRYPDAIAGDVSEKRLQRFFDRDGDGYVVKQFLREMILFTHHDLLQDPPFSKLDLISCRNVLIYLKTDVQTRIFTLFHFALKLKGFLFLGGSESLGNAAKLFDELDRKAKIFQARRVPVADMYVPLLPNAPRGTPKPPEHSPQPRRFEEIAREELLGRYAPPCVIVGDNYDVTYISGRVGKYLEPGTGAANYNILDMARDGLRVELRTALYKAFHGGEPVQGKPVSLRVNGHDEVVALTVRPLAEAEGHVLVVFEEASPHAASVPPEPPPHEDGDRLITQLETELTSTRESLQTSIEELETSNEELRASNEELQSVNEELQSTTEELETGKEELQSANEELLAVNQELRVRNEELVRSNSDLNNLITSTDIATLFLDGELRVRRYAPRATDIFNLIASDVGRPFAHLTHRLVSNDLVGDAERALRELTLVERELSSTDGRFYQARLRPYRTTDNKVDGVVLTCVDVTDRHVQEDRTRALNHQLVVQQAYNENIIATVREPMLVLDGELRVVTANRAFYRDFMTTPDLTEHMLVYELGDKQWDIPDLRHLLEEVLPHRITVDDFEVRHDFGAGERIVLLNARRIQQKQRQEGMESLILLAFDDVTESRQGQQAVIVSEAKYRNLFDSIDEGFCIVKMLYDPAGKPVDYRFLEANPAFARQSGLVDVAGKRIRELAPTYEQYWFDLFANVVTTGEPVRFERYSAALGRWFDVYALREDGAGHHRVAVLLNDISRRKQAERAMARLASIIDSTDDAIVSKDLAGVITTWNKAAEHMFGYTAAEAVGRPTTELIVPADRVEEEADILRRIARGETIDHFETVRCCKDGSHVEVSVTISPLRNKHGDVVGASKIARDIGDRKRDEEHRDLLIHELNHRVKNTLATVQALAAQTFRNADTQRARKTFEARLLALSAAHDVLTRESWKGAWITEIVSSALAAWITGAATRIDVAGPPLRLRPSVALALAMALHELATNAIKYGALSNQSGTVAIHWTISGDAPGVLSLRWRERGGPSVQPPTQRGFGSRLIEHGLSHDLGGQVQLLFNAGGVECSIDAPLDDVREETSLP
jgi:PAS domain S-box-containing protein